MPLPVRYIDSREYSQDGTVLQSTDNSDGENYLPRPSISFPILEVATSSQKLQALGLHNLTNVIRQLGSLAKHAESVMGDIADILVSYQRRTVDLEERTKRLSEDVLSSLDVDREGEQRVMTFVYTRELVIHAFQCFAHLYAPRYVLIGMRMLGHIIAVQFRVTDH